MSESGATSVDVERDAGDLRAVLQDAPIAEDDDLGRRPNFVEASSLAANSGLTPAGSPMASAMVGRVPLTANGLADISVSFVNFFDDATEEVVLSIIKCRILHSECKMWSTVCLKRCDKHAWSMRLPHDVVFLE